VTHDVGDLRIREPLLANRLRQSLDQPLALARELLLGAFF
jgi:hypothetical protein